ncbi:hypothetical protein HZA45_01495 [Candidatus Peregrinibacteria bacterium]|nr:hypothetical protein [Candidatus Peregrinibacteria bacterium]
MWKKIRSVTVNSAWIFLLAIVLGIIMELVLFFISIDESTRQWARYIAILVIGASLIKIPTPSFIERWAGEKDDEDEDDD